MGSDRVLVFLFMGVKLIEKIIIVIENYVDQCFVSIGIDIVIF